MKKQFMKITTGIALVALLIVQGIWLYNTYTLLHKNLVAELENGFARSIEKEIYLRLDNTKDQRIRGDTVKGIRPDNDFYLNALAFHEYLLSYDFAFSMATLDSIWAHKLKDDIGTVNYRLLKTDADGKPTERIDRGAHENSPYTFMIEKPVREDHSEYIRVYIDSPHKLVIGKMLFLLVTSLLIVLILVYCLYLQITMISRQDRIAAIRQDFTQSMIHDMKNPISNILVSANTLKGGQLDSQIKVKNRYFDIILKEGNRLLSFTNKILTIAKFEDRKVNLAKQDMDLNVLFDDLIKEYLVNPPKEIRFTTDFADAPVIHADPDYIVDVFRNLIDNAVKYSKESVAIHIQSEKDRQHTILKIRDNGIGISAGDQKRIFKKYERVHSPEEKRKGGFGLGLSFVDQVISAHNGTITVDSVPGSYSEFILFIPTKKNDKTVTD